MTNIKFAPWKGDHYTEALFGKRILIVGESHYAWEGSGNIDEQPDVTTEIIEGVIEGDDHNKFWTNIAIAVLGRKPTSDEKGQFWHKVAFYNYVQCSVGNAPRIRPTGEQWDHSEPAFFEALDLLKPELIIVLGFQNWENTPSLNFKYDQKLSTQFDTHTGRYSYNGGCCLAVNIKHPSAGFNGLDWHETITEAIKLA